MCKLIIALGCIFVFILAQAEGAKILGIFHFPVRSHYMGGAALMRILAERGHNITMVSAFGEENPPKNYRDVVLKETLIKWQDEMKDLFDFDMHPYIFTYYCGATFPAFLNGTVAHPKFKKLLESEKFDLVISEQFFSYGMSYIAHRLDVPLIFYSPTSASRWSNPSVANPASPSYVPDMYTDYTSEMTFFQRLDNAVMYVIVELVLNFVEYPAHDKIIQENFPGAPHISEYNHRASVVLLNGDAGTSDPVPKVPGMIDVGGFHIKPPKPLPKDLAEVLDNAKDGVILFSMGSNLKISQMSKKTVTAILNVFSEMKQTVVLKWENDSPPKTSGNVIFRKWLPQNDILAHRNIKLFITHGGIRSLQETVYHGVPCLTFPVFADQKSNSKKAALLGYAKWILVEDITEKTLRPLLKELLQNPKYAEEARKRSSIMRDTPLSPADTIAFWVDYVIRHKGADHLKVAALKLSWYQYLLLDVIAFIVICFIVLIFSIKYLCKIVIGKLKGTKTKKKLN